MNSWFPILLWGFWKIPSVSHPFIFLPILEKYTCFFPKLEDIFLPILEKYTFLYTFFQNWQKYIPHN